MPHYCLLHKTTDTRQRIEKAKAKVRPQARMVVAQIESGMTDFLLQAFTAFRGELDTKTIAKLLFDRDTEGVAEHVLSRFEPIMAGLDEEIMRGVALSGAAAMKELGPRFNRIGFDVARETAIQWAEERSALMVQQIAEETRQSLNQLITDGMKANRHPNRMAKDIRERVGLIQRHQRAVDRKVEQWKSMGLPQDRIDSKRDAYTKKLLNYRAENIARTETMSSINNGRLSAWKQLQEDGYIEPGQKKKWLVSWDERLCPICKPMKNQERNLDEVFRSPLGFESLSPPIHPQCRCTMSLMRKQ